MTKEVMQQALEALENHEGNYKLGNAGCDRQEAAITAIKEALAQPVQEPVACRFCHSKKGCWAWQCYHCGEIDDVQQPAAKPEQQAEPCIAKDPQCPCQDGDACHYKDCKGTKAWPVQRPWVGLTEFQFAEIYNKWNDTNGSTPWGLNQALEAKLRKLNT
jgi:hypothetical protein